jgi:flagellar hook-associated protein 2
VAGTSSISGLASGLDSAAIVTQLMSIESRPQTLLKAKLATTQSQVTAYQGINTAFASLLSAAENLGKAATWSAAAAKSSATSVIASAGADAQTGSLTFKVEKLATAHSTVSASTWSTTTEDTGLGGTLTLSTSASPITLDTDGDGKVTLPEAAAAINAAGAGVKASVVSTGSGYKLQLAAAATGAAAAFTATPSVAGATAFGVLTAGQDATIAVGDPATTGYRVTSPTNTFSGVLAGTTFTVSQPDVTATVSVDSDPKAVTAAVQKLVAAATSVLGMIKDYTDKDSRSAVLAGDWSVKQLRSQVLDTMTTAIGGRSASVAGLKVERDGTLSFDAETFTKALEKDPALVQGLFTGAVGVGRDNVSGTVDDVATTDGLAARLAVLAAKASDKVSGSLTVLAKGREDRVDDLQDQIDDWGLRLELRESTLTAKFTAMETALAVLNSQSGWLTQQIKSIPSWSE